MLVRVLIAKVRNPARLEEVLARVPVGPDDDQDFNCVAWVKTALESLGDVLAPELRDGSTVRIAAIDYARKKKDEHRWDGKGDYDQSKAATFSLLDGRELIP